MDEDVKRIAIGWGLIALGVVVGGLGLAAAVAHLRAADESLEAEATASAVESAEPQVSDLDPAPEPPSSRLAEGALGPIITDPDPDRIPLCDERNWPLVGEVVASVGPASGVDGYEGTAYVYERMWTGLTPVARMGIASWASKCILAEGRVRVVDTQTGVELGHYDPSIGFRSASGSSP